MLKVKSYEQSASAGVAATGTAVTSATTEVRRAFPSPTSVIYMLRRGQEEAQEEEEEEEEEAPQGVLRFGGV